MTDDTKSPIQVAQEKVLGEMEPHAWNDRMWRLALAKQLGTLEGMVTTLVTRIESVETRLRVFENLKQQGIGMKWLLSSAAILIVGVVSLAAGMIKVAEWLGNQGKTP